MGAVVLGARAGLGHGVEVVALGCAVGWDLEWGLGGFDLGHEIEMVGPGWRNKGVWDRGAELGWWHGMGTGQCWDSRWVLLSTAPCYHSAAAVIGTRLHVPVAISCVLMAFYVLVVK